MNLELIYKAFPFIKNLSKEEEEYFLKSIKVMRFKPKENIHNPERDCKGLFLVEEGELRVYILSQGGREITLYRLKKGDVCALSASCLLESISFDVFIDSEADTRIYQTSSKAFGELQSKNIYVENFALNAAIEKFSEAMWSMEQILFMSFDKRLATFLLEESGKNKGDLINLTQDQIARYMGSAREVVSRMLKYFEREGIVEIGRGHLKIIDKNKLRKILI